MLAVLTKTTERIDLRRITIGDIKPGEDVMIKADLTFTIRINNIFARPGGKAVIHRHVGKPMKT
ncbi:hypothetical protein TH19_11135 [Thalassospira profundimaris]|uniref:Uncharacterized protein n=1 Tax=Thalassospira profundimaris TaxID=502049 RepID=A0A367W9I1_9PROT|nr:hypothetical protein TH19_11135 [Thalassospira profundimaris]